LAKLIKKINNPIATISIAIPIGVTQPKIDSIFYPQSSTKKDESRALKV